MNDSKDDIDTLIINGIVFVKQYFPFLKGACKALNN